MRPLCVKILEVVFFLTSMPVLSRRSALRIYRAKSLAQVLADMALANAKTRHSLRFTGDDIRYDNIIWTVG